jgi:hypothetical protein
LISNDHESKPNNTVEVPVVKLDDGTNQQCIYNIYFIKLCWMCQNRGTQEVQTAIKNQLRKFGYI